jgi:hypothetical protein
VDAKWQKNNTQAPNSKFKISMTETLFGILPAGLWAGLIFGHWILFVI